MIADVYINNMQKKFETSVKRIGRVNKELVSERTCHLSKHIDLFSIQIILFFSQVKFNLKTGILRVNKYRYYL